MATLWDLYATFGHVAGLSPEEATADPAAAAASLPPVTQNPRNVSLCRRGLPVSQCEQQRRATRWIRSTCGRTGLATRLFPHGTSSRSVQRQPLSALFQRRQIKQLASLVQFV